jgi:hypothetical protein
MIILVSILWITKNIFSFLLYSNHFVCACLWQVLFRLPLFREAALLAGTVDAGKAIANRMLREGKSLGILVRCTVLFLYFCIGLFWF